MKVVTPVIVDKLSVAMVPLLVKVVMPEIVVRFTAVSVPLLVKLVTPESVVLGIVVEPEFV